MQISSSYSLKNHNTFGLEAVASTFIEYSSEDELIEVLNRDDIRERKLLHIGEGSNLLFVAKNIDLVLHSTIRFIERISVEGSDVELRVGAGINWDELCGYACDNGLCGIENLSHIPGEVGAAAVQNIGAYGVEVADVIRYVEAVDIKTGEVKKFSKEECKYGYRASVFKNELKDKYIITVVGITLSNDFKPKLEYSGLKDSFIGVEDISLSEVRKKVIEIRKSKLPDVKELGSAGSFFKNPVVSSEIFDALISKYTGMPHYRNNDGTVKIPAAWLIDQCGFKGMEYNGAAVYKKQALVIVNLGTARGEDIESLSRRVQAVVKEKFDINIEPEVQFVY